MVLSSVEATVVAVVPATEVIIYPTCTPKPKLLVSVEGLVGLQIATIDSTSEPVAQVPAMLDAPKVAEAEATTTEKETLVDRGVDPPVVWVEEQTSPSLVAKRAGRQVVGVSNRGSHR